MEESVDDQFPASIEVETEGRTQSGGAGKGANGLELEHGGVSGISGYIDIYLGHVEVEAADCSGERGGGGGEGEGGGVGGRGGTGGVGGGAGGRGEGGGGEQEEEK
ncbi:hypothetical protein PABG_11900 [Paracoccidioides brasiliensis Pb03]|nr:hypothetical protein PABG_11900 [Paracoccidioides brasiliensis Pb03]